VPPDGPGTDDPPGADADERRAGAPAPDGDADRRDGDAAAAPERARRGGWTLVPDWSIAHPVGTSILMLIGAVMGLLFFTRLRVDLLPQIVFPQVRASVVSEGVDPGILEQTVTRELESGLAATENATRISSTTREGNASVVLEFDYSADIDVALADASAALERVRSLLPEGADPPIIFKADPSEIPVVELAVTSDALDLVKLRTFADRVLSDRLATTPGVASVDAVGGRERELVVTLDPGRLRGLGLSVGDVVSAVSAANRDEPGGAVTTGRAMCWPEPKRACARSRSSRTCRSRSPGAGRRRARPRWAPWAGAPAARGAPTLAAATCPPRAARAAPAAPARARRAAWWPTPRAPPRSSAPSATCAASDSATSARWPTPPTSSASSRASTAARPSS
jgi:hypothetical protein